MTRHVRHRTSILQGVSGRAATALFVAIAGCNGGLVAQSLDWLVEDLVEQQVERQVEAALDEALARTVQADLDDALEDASRTLGRAGATASAVVNAIVEVTPPLAEAFQPDLDSTGRTIERGVWVVLVDPAQIERIERRGFAVRELRRLDALSRVLIRVEAEAGRELVDAAAELTSEIPGARLDFNHVYRGVTGPGATRATNSAAAAQPAPHVTIGIIDSAVAVEHEALRDTAIVQRDFVPYDRSRPQDHGTAVGSILVGNSAAMRGVLGGARLYAASVFFEDAAGLTAATTASLVQALDWLVASGVRVINMSLAGPPNRVLEAALEQVAARGTVVVAAVGNNGPVGEPLYPAAYASVVGITAVDSQDRVYLYANRGRQVTFAAFGVDVPVARSAGGYGRESGTSMAAPHAAAIIARKLADPAATPRRVLSSLEAGARDLGRPGFDEIYGHGLILAKQ